MKVWYDACTGKHTRYGSAIGKEFRKRGHEFVFTTREHPDTLPLMKILGEKPVVVGKYDPTTNTSRLKESAQRIIEFADIFEKNGKPDVAVAHQSVELCRVAFGLGIPIILTADTPHALAVNRLTIPFAHTVVVSEGLPISFTKTYAAQRTVTFRGVDEAGWIQRSKPPKIKTKKPLIVLRQVETKAVYAKDKTDSAKNLAEKLAELGEVHLLERYNLTGKEFAQKPAFEDSATLIAKADLVVSYGGTISREAALLGVPSIAVSDMARTPVNRYTAKMGFPLFIISEQKVMELAKRYLGRRFDVADKLAEMENPVKVIADIAEKLEA